MQTAALILEMAWLGVFVFAVVAGVASWLWARRPWRDRRTFGERYAEMMDRKWSTCQARELEQLEAEVQAQGFDIWRPDPSRVREVIEPR